MFWTRFNGYDCPTLTDVQILEPYSSVERGQTALHVAVQNGERKICYLLVSAGAPLLAVDKQDRTAQQIAEQTRDYDLAKYLECKYLLCTTYPYC
ncbi:hypothetical protein QTP88_024701 [Uroleucon formosanum]